MTWGNQVIPNNSPDISNKRTLLLQATKDSAIVFEQIIEAVVALEKLKQRGDLSTLAGEWKLIWTSGTQQYQTFKQNQQVSLRQNGLSKNHIIQRLDVQAKRIENDVYFSFGSLRVSGAFEYTEQKRIEFIFDQMQLKLGNLPTLKLPLGRWAKGWLQTTYLDEELHIERGDRGGISVYVRIG